VSRIWILIQSGWAGSVVIVLCGRDRSPDVVSVTPGSTAGDGAGSSGRHCQVDAAGVSGLSWGQECGYAVAWVSRRWGGRRGLLYRGKTSFGMLKRMHPQMPCCPVLPPRLAFAGLRFPWEVIVLTVRWYLRYGLGSGGGRCA
jgi:hypothetical protein